MPALKPYSIFLMLHASNRSLIQTLYYQVTVSTTLRLDRLIEVLSRISMEGTKILCIGNRPAGICPVSSLTSKNLMKFFTTDFFFYCNYVINNSYLPSERLPIKTYVA